VDRAAPRRPIDEWLGVSGINDFIFRDIEDDEAARAVFDFVVDPEARDLLGVVLRGVRWQQKVGLALARQHGHPAHAAQVRSQMIEYGALVEMSLHEVVRQAHPTGVPATFQGLIQRAQTMGVLDEHGVEAADRLREARNCVHLYLATPSLRFQREGRKALRDFTTVVNQLRVHASLPPWHAARQRPDE
jgi:hypothetical protein